MASILLALCAAGRGAAGGADCGLGCAAVLHPPGQPRCSIERDSEVANDFPASFAGTRKSPACSSMVARPKPAFRRHSAAVGGAGQPMARLPSTSPANASFSFERKLAAWQCLLLPPSTSG
ncbi:MAG: hypothetical protein IPO00_09020 [Betaproteobacteria bacterium]|nr:hypothetical protein [Betaproteobacteria bacterium]